MAEYVNLRSLESALKIADSIAKANGKDKDRQIWARAIRLLNDMPTVDAVPVVRCKDCKYNRGSKKCLNPDSFFAVPKDDDFCSYGERKEEPHDRLQKDL